MATSEQTTPADGAAAEAPLVPPAPPLTPPKPALVALDGIADSVYESLQGLFQTLAARHGDVVARPVVNDAEVKSQIDDAIAHTVLHQERVQSYQKIVLEVVILRLYTAICQAAYAGADVDYTGHARDTFLVWDMALILTAKCGVADIDLPFLVLHKIVLKNDREFLLHHFQTGLFSEQSHVRRSVAQRECGVTVPTARPGTEVVEIHNSLESLLHLDCDAHVRFLAKFRVFVSEFFGLTDFLADDHRINTNKHFGVENELFKSLKRSADPVFNAFVRVRYHLTYPDTLFGDRWGMREKVDAFYYLKDAVVKEDKAKKPARQADVRPADVRPPHGQQHRTPSGLELQQLESLAKEFRFAASFNMDEGLFVAMFKTDVFRKSLLLQMHMFASEVTAQLDKNGAFKTFTLRGDTRATRDTWLKLKSDIEAHYKSGDKGFFHLLKGVSQDSNVNWHEWKHNPARYPKLAPLKDGRISKAKEALAKNAKIRNRHVQRYGTAEISRIWTLQTGLSDAAEDRGSGEEAFGRLRDDLERAAATLGSIEEDPEMYTESEIADARSRKEMLAFKALRLYRENGNWLAFSHTNYKLGVAGLFDGGLAVEFKQQRQQQEQELAAKAQEADGADDADGAEGAEGADEGANGADGDVEMAAAPQESKEEAPAKPADDDLDY